MNAPFVVAQASSQASAGTPRVIRIVPPAGGDRVQIALGSDDQARLDLTALAGQAFTLVRAAETLIILFDNNSAVEVHPFFDRASGPRADITIEMAPGQVVSGAEFVALFPVTDDPSVLPAAGDVNSSGFAFTAVAIDALGTPAPLPLLGSEVLPDVIATQDFARGLDILALRPSDTESLPPPPPPPPPFDDAPVAVSDAATVEAGAVAPVDLILIIDASESMNRITGDFGFTTYSEVARMLLTGLINAAEVNQLSIVWSGAAPGGAFVINYGTDTDQALLDMNSFSTVGVAPYDLMLQLAVNVLQTWSTQSQAADHTLVYFVSDDGINGVQIPFDWNEVLQNYGVEASYAIGLGGGVNPSALGSIAWPNDAANATVVTNSDELSRLQGVLPTTLPGAAQGNVLTDGVDDRFGADGPGPGAGIVSITVDGFIYTYDADLDQITSTNPTIAGATLDVSTALGGHLTFHFEAGFGFEAGDYSYAPPADVEAGTVETFHYIIADADGDQAGADLVITIQESQSPAPIVERGLDTSSWPGDDLGMAEIFEDESGSAGGANSMPAMSLDPVPGAITTVLEDAANASQVAAT